MELLDKEKLQKMKGINRKKEAQIVKAKKMAAAVALTGVVGAAVAGRVIEKCHANEASKAICPITQIETILFGYEKGLDHQAADLVRESKQTTKENSKTKIEDVLTIEGKEEYVVPSGYVLDEDTAYKAITSNKITEPMSVIYTEVMGDTKTVKKWTYDTMTNDYLNVEELTAGEEKVYKLLKTK